MALLPRRSAFPPLEGDKGGVNKASTSTHPITFHSLLNYPVSYRLCIISYITIIYSYHPQTYCTHLPVTLGVTLLCLCGEMRITVNLYHQIQLFAIEICNVIQYRILSTKRITHILCPQTFP